MCIVIKGFYDIIIKSQKFNKRGRKNQYNVQINSLSPIEDNILKIPSNHASFVMFSFVFVSLGLIDHYLFLTF